MRGTAYSKKKPWRKFKRGGSADRLIRKICCSLLVLEAAVLISRSGLGVLSVERTQREWLSAAPGVQGEMRPADNLRDDLRDGMQGSDESDGMQSPDESAGVLEKIFGIRLRLRDGAIEFYRQEDIREIEN